MIQKKKIAFAGNMLVDVVKNVDCYPELGMLANIKGVSKCVGGCVCNPIIDLAKMDSKLMLLAFGKVGNDDYGRYILERMQGFGIDTSGVKISENVSTSFTDVMSLPSGERTFFHSRGANAEFSPADVDLNDPLWQDVQILHAGYILLLDAMDAEDKEYGTVMARFLHDVQQKGVKTSIDVVSDSNADYYKKIVPALKYSNYAIMNEIESSSIFGLPPRDENGRLSLKNMEETMRKMAACGVKDKVIVHSKEMGLCLDVTTGKFTAVPSLKLPKELIKGSVGAGDAFCAGCLYGIYRGDSDEELLKFASASAACNLFADNSIDGMRSVKEIRKLTEQYERLSL